MSKGVDTSYLDDRAIEQMKMTVKHARENMGVEIKHAHIHPHDIRFANRITEEVGLTVHIREQVECGKVGLTISEEFFE